MIRPIMRKDWSLLWPLVAIAIVLQISLAWFAHSSGLFGGELAPRELRRPLTVAWFAAIGALVVAVVHQDPIPGADQDWLIRPLPRTELLLSKLLFAVLVVCGPMLALDCARVLAAGFSLSAALPVIVYKEVYLLICFVIPVMALAAITATMAELLVLGTTLAAIFAAALSLEAWLLGAEHCPTCDSGVSWIQHVLQHAGVLVGAGVVLLVQYYHRRTAASRALAVIGALALVFGQLPWSVAFGIQRWLAPAPHAAQAIRFVFDEERSRAPQQESVAAGSLPPSTRRSTAGAAERYFERHGPARTAPVLFQLPVRIDGLRPDELLLVDRSDVALLGSDGTPRYRGLNPGELNPPGPVHSADLALMQAIALPARVYRDLGAQQLPLRLDYSITLMKVRGQHVISAVDGVLRTEELGACATRPDEGGSLIQLRCQKIGLTPFCIGVTARGPADQNNPEVLQCDPDYRPYLPTLTDALNRFGVDVPIRDPTGLTHYPLEAANIRTLQLLIKVYAVQEHAVRSLLTPRIRLIEASMSGK
ncbi:MAG TPA: hypothetical protein VE819_12595 [Steroidobacteraceae bacterium]|jgi:hypothetical protein|nr:hypothetical protein [Steroidobacteraceae bacterium]